MNKEQLVATLKELFKDGTINIYMRCDDVKMAHGGKEPGITFAIEIDGEIVAEVDDTFDLTKIVG